MLPLHRVLMNFGKVLNHFKVVSLSFNNRGPSEYEKDSYFFFRIPIGSTNFNRISLHSIRIRIY